jgi:hypothetical protein
MLLVVLALSAMIAAPALAAGGKSSAPGQNKDKPAKAPITISGTIEAATNADGKKAYTLTDGGKTYKLNAGPHWYFDEGAYPLDKYVGQAVTVEGEIAEGSDEVDVISVSGTALRDPGKPPWAGGWKAVGERHPGWSQDKADRMKAKFGDCFPPGQCRDKPERPLDGDDGTTDTD